MEHHAQINTGEFNHLGETVNKNDNMSLMSFEKLDGTTNYNSWKFLMELYLTHEDLWEYTQTTPEDGTGRKRDQKARAKICLMVKPECLIHVRQAKTAREAWHALEKAYEDKGLNNRCRLLSKLVSLKLEQFQTIREYVSALITTSQKLSDLGKEIDDELLAALMLQGLTENFQAMRLAIENSNIELTTDYVKTKLYQMEETHTATNANNQALMSKRNNYAQKQKKKLECFICKGPHKAVDCQENRSRRIQSDEASVAFALATSHSEADWIVDSGASNHMTSKREWLHDVKKFEREVVIACANGEKLKGIGSGTVVSGKPNVTINAMYVPGLASNLLSVSAVTKKDLNVVFFKGGFNVVKSDSCKILGEPLLTGVEENGVYKLKQSLEHTALVTTVSSEMELWHKRMGHLGVRNLKLLRDRMATGVSFSNSSLTLECVACLKGKQTRQSFKKGSTASRADNVLDLVHTDVCGPMNVESFSGFKYFVTFIDDFSRKTFIYFLKCKSEVFDKLEEFKTFAELQTGKKLKAIRSDNGTEYVNTRMKDFMKKYGIKHQLTVEYTPEQNGVAERANRTIVEKARSMIQEAGLSNKLWAEAVKTAVYLKNRSPTIAVRNKTPEEVWTGKKQNLKSIRVFGCRAFKHIPIQKRTKWDPKSKEFVHIGYCEESKAYRLFDPETQMVHKGRDVVFFESQFHLAEKSSDSRRDETLLIMEDDRLTNNERENTRDVTEFGQQQQQQQRELETEEEHNETVREITAEHSNYNQEESFEEWESVDGRDEEDVEDIQSESNEEVEQQLPESEREIERRYPLRERKPREFPDHVTYQALESDLPLTVSEALSSSDKEKWRNAIEEEMNALRQNNTWTLVKPPKSSNIVDSKWLFRIKEEAGGKVRYKARLVARGFSQRRGIDYFETFAPVIRHGSLRALIALAAREELKIDQMDVKTAFLNGDLHEVVYMKQPEGLEVKGKEDHVCLLHKSLYGLKQAPRAWNAKLHSQLTRLKFKRSENEPCVYMRTQDGKIIIIAVYVDDILIFWNNKHEMLKVKSELMSSFDMKDLGKAELMLGIHIVQDATGIKLHQEKYVDKILKAYNMEDCKTVVTPAVPGQRLEKPAHDRKPDGKIPYRALIGSLMYLAVCTRPDIAHVVNYLSQFNECYEEQHWVVAKRVLRYLKGTKSHGLRYFTGRKPQEVIEAFADADYAGDSDRHSYSGSVFLIQGGAVSWQSTKQRTIALSTAEAEYVSVSEAVREAIFLRRFLAEVSDGRVYKLDEAITIYSDSQSAIAMAKNPVHHQRTKHVDVRYHFVREAIVNNFVKLKYKETACMVADVLTKPLPRGKFEWCVRSMGMCV